LSGLLPALPGISRIRLPSVPIESLRRPDGGVLSPPHGHEAPRGARFPCSARVRHDWVWTSSLPRGRRCSYDRRDVLGRRLPPSNGRPLSPQQLIPSRDVCVTRHQQGFKVVRPPSLSLACGPRMEREPLGFTPELHTRLCRTQPRMSGQGQVSNTNPSYVLDIKSNLLLRSYSPRATSRRTISHRCILYLRS
jgi:hypothetical protein